jgi:anaerobic ribonucleoside-triphosphate reductase
LKKKSEAQLYLEQVEKIDAIVEGKLIEQRQWKELALNITANMEGERVQSSSATTSKMEDAVIQCLMVEEQISEEVKRLIARKQDVVRTIESLYNPTEYRILHMRYIRYIPFDEIAVQMDKDYSWVTTTHGRAVRHVQDILSKEKNNG